MEKDVNIELYNNTLDQYDKMLGKFREWTKYKRDIKINSLLESKRIEYTVELNDLSGNIYISSVSDADMVDFNSLTNACGIIKKMTFIIYENKVEKLDIKIRTLDSYYGKIINNIIKSGIGFKINQYLDRSSNKITGFYINNRKMTA